MSLRLMIATLAVIVACGDAAAYPTSKPVLVSAEDEFKAGRESRWPSPFVGTWNCPYQGRTAQMIWTQIDRYIERCTSATVCQREYKSTSYVGRFIDQGRQVSFHYDNWNGVEAFFKHPDGNAWKAMPTRANNYGGSVNNQMRYEDAVRLHLTTQLRGVSTKAICTRAP